MKNKILAALIAILAFGQGAMAASTFTVSNPTGSTFRITRTGNTAVSETIDWRVVSLSAIAGVHFTGVGGQYSGTVTFDANDTYRDVTISESTPGDDAYKYQNGTSRNYRFEVLDRDGYILASKDRSMTTGTSVPSSGLFNEKEITIFTTGTQFTDAGYNQSNNPHYIESSAYYNLTGIAPKAYYTLIGAQLRSTLSLEAREENNGYQYVQILINNISTCDNRSDCSNGDPGNINLSRYMAGFDHEPSKANTNYATYTFPVTSQPNNCSEVSNAWSNGVTNKLYTQKFNTNCRATDGRLILPLDFEKFVVRFNASGGGSDHDEWLAKNVKAHIQACDPTAPTVLSNYKVSGGRHQKGNTIYVSVAFSEIVTVTGTPTLSSNWGTLSYVAGSGSNVLTFMGTIDPSDNNAFGVSGYTLNGGTIKDLAGNSFSGSISHSFGTTLDEDYAWTTSDFNQLETNTYEIYTTLDMRHLALMVNSGNNNNCSGLTFRQTHDITYTHKTEWDDATSTENNYIAIGTDDNPFLGTFDGQGYTVSGIRIYRGGTSNSDYYQGLFGVVRKNGTVKRVTLSDARITGYNEVGGIAAHTYYSSIEDCTVDANVCIHAVQSNTYDHGGIVGYNQAGPVNRCISRATLTVANSSGCKDFGGIVGLNKSNVITDCIAEGVVIPDVNARGAIVGFKDDYYDNTLTRNYYHGCKVASDNVTPSGVGMGTKSSKTTSDVDGASALWAVTLPNHASVVRTPATDPLPGTNNMTYDNGADINGVPYAKGASVVNLSYDPATITEGYDVLLAVKKTSDNTAVTFTDNGDYTYKINMPTADITVTVTEIPIIAYIDADGNPQSHACTPIVSKEFPQYYGAEGQTNWYYVSGPVNSRQIEFSDATSNIILCDGATLSINAGSLSGIINENGSVNIFSQSRGSGSITVSGTSYSSDKGIYAKSNIDINGGTFTSSVTNYGLYSKEGDVTIRGGIVNISARYDGIYGKENVNIIGGIVNASSTSSNSSYGGINSSGNITIGVSSASDRITASSYKYTTLKVADGQILTDGTDTYTGTLNADQIAAIAGKTLRMPFDPAEATVNLTAHSGTLAGQTHYWATFYHPNWNYTLPAGAKAYIVKEDKNLYRVGDGTIIPAGVAVVIMAESASLTLTATNANAPAVVGNILQGSDSTVPVAGLSGTPYVLGKVGDVLGFYQYTGTSIPAGKAYYLVVP